jgi:cell division septation protein DedD
MQLGTLAASNKLLQEQTEKDAEVIREQHLELSKANASRKLVEDQNSEMKKQYAVLLDAFKERDRLLTLVKARYDEEVRKLAEMDR